MVLLFYFIYLMYFIYFIYFLYFVNLYSSLQLYFNNYKTLCNMKFDLLILLYFYALMLWLIYVCVVLQIVLWQMLCTLCVLLCITMTASTSVKIRQKVKQISQSIPGTNSKVSFVIWCTQINTPTYNKLTALAVYCVWHSEVYLE
jgi:hypothetical protein